MIANRAVLISAVLVALGLGDPAVMGAPQDPPDVTTLGPQVGELVPDFTLPDQTGTPRSLESILGRNGALLVFFRSADW